MQKTDTTLRLEADLVKNNWEFTEVWIDPNLSPPYLLLLLSDAEGNCRIYDPAEGYKVVFSTQSYDEAQYWLLEDEYEPVEGRLSVSELVGILHVGAIPYGIAALHALFDNLGRKGDRYFITIAIDPYKLQKLIYWEIRLFSLIN